MFIPFLMRTSYDLRDPENTGTYEPILINLNHIVYARPVGEKHTEVELTKGDFAIGCVLKMSFKTFCNVVDEHTGGADVHDEPDMDMCGDY